MTSRPVIGIVTIGQTPRPDLEATFSAAAPHADVRVAGALDGLAARDIQALAVPGPYPLLVRLAGGATAEVPRDALVPRINEVAASLAAGGASLVVLACAGAFPDVSCAVPLLVPGRLVPAAVRAMAGGGRVGIVTPNAAQAPYAEQKWRGDGFDVMVTHAAPLHAAELASAAALLSAADVSLVVLDCMGHDDRSRRAFAAACGRPTVAAQPLTAGLAGAMV